MPNEMKAAYSSADKVYLGTYKNEERWAQGYGDCFTAGCTASGGLALYVNFDVKKPLKGTAGKTEFLTIRSSNPAHAQAIHGMTPGSDYLIFAKRVPSKTMDNDPDFEYVENAPFYLHPVKDNLPLISELETCNLR